MQDLKAELVQLIGRELSSIEFVRDYLRCDLMGLHLPSPIRCGWMTLMAVHRSAVTGFVTGCAP